MLYLVPRHVVLQQINFCADKWPMHLVQLTGSNMSTTLFATSPPSPPLFPKFDSIPLIEARKGSVAKKEATARREREGGKFKRLKTKWIVATDFFKPSKDETSTNSNLHNHRNRSQYNKMYPTATPIIIGNAER